ncbi:hypothetical protein OG552_30825 [Streptomyces sp. NBC_01476]|uniref:hypothetical protein n=1 Tax=Streptomyces sp. NBC_01476 TaxID=2903881 RepID=UPI002E2F0AE8|nr:hypothetical protein [Streptomyces sp. NBC_01476]
MLDQSAEDHLVPMRRHERLTATLAGVAGLRIVRGRRLTGNHAAPWEDGITIHRNLLRTLRLLREGR